VIHLLSNAIPIIAIQASLIESNGVRSLFFTTVLNTYEELDDGTTIDEQNFDKEFWNRKAKWVSDIADALLPIVGRHFDAPFIGYVKNYISITSGSYHRLRLHPRIASA
jgi:hypothetical protein